MELQLDSLHTAAECCDGLKTDLTCQEQLRQPASTLECLLTETKGREGERIKEDRADTVVCALGEICCLEKEESFAPASVQQHSVDPQEDWVCLGSNSEEKACQRANEGRADSCPSLNLCDRGERAQGEAEGESVTVGNVPAEGCRKQAEETDTGEAVIREEQEAESGEEPPKQEAKDCAATRREEESRSQLTVLTSANQDTDSSVMGQSPLSGSAELLNISQSERKPEENGEEEQTEPTQELLDGSDPVEEEFRREEFRDPFSTPRDLPSPSQIVYGDVIDQRESVVPRLLIEGLHEGDPPPDINSQEQKQETAGGDYTAEQDQGSLPQAACHSLTRAGAASDYELDGKDAATPQGVVSVELKDVDFRMAGGSQEETQTDQLNGQPSQGNMLTKRKAEHDSGVAPRVSSDDEGSFRSFGSSSTEIFHPTQDDDTMQEGDMLPTTNTDMSSTGCIEDPNDLKPSVSQEKPGEDTELPLNPGTVVSLIPSEGSREGLDPDLQLSANFQTIEVLIPEGSEELLTERPEEDSLLDPVLLLCEDAPTAGEGDIKKHGSSDVNVEIQHDSSELSAIIQSEWGLSGGEENKANGSIEDDHQMDISDNLEAAGESGNVQMQPEQDNSRKTVDTESGENHLAVSSSQDADPPSDTVDGCFLELEPHASIAEVSRDLHVEDQVADHPDAGDAVDGALESCPASERGGRN